ncbi:MAG: lasso peptide biosynthesis protein [Actinomycetes bacterium]
MVWCHGVATDPIRLHAWITVDGVPVAEPASIARCTPLFLIPDAGQTGDRTETGEHRQPRDPPRTAAVATRPESGARPVHP